MDTTKYLSECLLIESFNNYYTSRDIQNIQYTNRISQEFNEIEMLLGYSFDKVKLLKDLSIISECTSYPLPWIIKDLKDIIVKNNLSTLDIVVNYLDHKYRGKRRGKNIMPTERLDAYGALCSGINLTILKDRTSNNFNKDSIKDVIFNNPATIVIWKDGTKTVVKCQDRDTYSEEFGLAMCIVKKCCGNKGNYNDVFNKWLPKEEKELA